MKKVLAILFAFNLFFINPIIFNQNNNFVYAQEDEGGDEGSDTGGDGEDIIINYEALEDNSGGDMGTADPADESFLSVIAGYVAGAIISVANTVASALNAVGLTTLGGIVQEMGMRTGTNAASEGGLVAVTAGAAASAATGGLGGIVVGQAVTGAIQGTLAGDIGDILKSSSTKSPYYISGPTSTNPTQSMPPAVVATPARTMPSTTLGTTTINVSACGNVNHVQDINKTYERVRTETIKPNWGDNDTFIIQINVKNTDTTKGTYPLTFDYSDSGASRANVRVTVSKTKCDFGPTAHWLGRPLGWQPTAADIARYTYASGAKATQYLGSNSDHDALTVNDARSGIFNLTPGIWYVTFQFLDTCADKNMSNPNRNTYCSKVIDFAGGVQQLATPVATAPVAVPMPKPVTSTIAPSVLSYLSLPTSNTVLNTINSFDVRKSTTGYNDLGVAVPKTLSIEDIINPSIINTVKAWVGLPVVDTRSLPPATVTPPVSTSTPPVSSGPSMVLVGTDTYNLGGANMDSVLTDSRSFFTYENLNWAALCANAQIKPVLTVNGKQDYTRQVRAGLEVYPFDVPANANYEGDFYAVGLSTSSNVPAHGFISDTPCPKTSPNVYKFGGNSGIGGAGGLISNTNYTGSAPGSVKVKPGRWYVTILWGSGDKPAPTSPNYAAWVDGTARLDVRFFQRLTATNPTIPTFTNARTINNSTCSINISGAQYGTVNTTLVYKKFPPNASGGYYLGSSSTVIPVATILAGLPFCPSGTSDGSVSSRAGNRSTFSALNVECKIGSDVYKLDYPTSCTTLCESANPNAFIDVRGDCVINGGGSF